jgi:hypothetical protein
MARFGICSMTVELECAQIVAGILEERAVPRYACESWAKDAGGNSIPAGVLDVRVYRVVAFENVGHIELLESGEQHCNRSAATRQADRQYRPRLGSSCI